MNSTSNLISELFLLLNKKKYFILLFSFLGSLLVGIYTYNIKEKYSTYSKVFPLSFSKSSSSPVDAIKSQFGITDKTDYSVIYNISVLVKSKSLSTNVVKQKTNVKKYLTIADWLISEYNNHLSFYQKKIIIPKQDTQSLYITGASLLIDATEILTDKTEFTKITTKTYNKDLSKLMNEKILEQLSDYYIEVSTEKPRTDLIKLKVLRDSLKDELDNFEKAIAGFQDANQLSVKYSTNIPQSKLIRSRIEIEQLYSTTASAYHNARFKLLSESPIFQILDHPGEPYDKIKPSWLKLSMSSFFIFCFLSALFFCRKILKSMLLKEVSAA